MAKLSTHILDTSIGKPAGNLTINLYKRQNNQSVLLKSVVSNKDGRCDQPLLENTEFVAGGYELEFLVEDYFKTQNVKSPFLKDVVIRCYVDNSSENYHIPLLISPFAYSTYRGS